MAHFIETIGHYLPTRQPAVVEINEAKAREWLSKGAQPSETCRSLLRKKGIVDAAGRLTDANAEVAAEPAEADRLIAMSEIENNGTPEEQTENQPNRGQSGICKRVR